MITPLFALVKQSSHCKARKKTYNWNKLQKLTPSNIREKNLMSR